MQALKRTGQDTVEGLAIPFGGLFRGGGKDVVGESFSPDTDYCFDWFGKSGRPVLYDHGFDGDLKSAVVGRQVEFETREEGIWAQAQLDASTKYRRAIDKLLDEEALAYSSGAMPHLVTKSAGRITRWPWVEVSLTPYPAASHYVTGVHYTKSAAYFGTLAEAGFDIPASLVAAAFKRLDDIPSDDEAAPGPEPLGERAGRVTADVRDLVAHAVQHAEMRVKTGRVLSDKSRQRLRELLSVRPSLLAAFDDLEAFLAENDPAADAPREAKSFDDELERIRARLFGVAA